MKCVPYRPRWYRCSGPLCATFLKAHLAKRSAALGRRDPCSGSANSQLSLAGDGLGPIQEDPPLPSSGAQRSARWSSLQASRILLGLLLEAFVGGGPLILGIDETLERRYGRKFAARGLYRDPVLSTHEQFVKS